jgi:hypothetical protein
VPQQSAAEDGCHPLKGPCQEERLILCEKIYFLAKFQMPFTSIPTYAEISFRFRLQPLLHQSPIGIKVMSEKIYENLTLEVIHSPGATFLLNKVSAGAVGNLPPL